MAKKFATYDEELALKLKEQYNLKDTTLRVWRHRQGIPLRYLQEGGWPQGEKASKSQEEKLKACLALPYINRARLGVVAHRMNDFHFAPQRVRLMKEEAKLVLGNLRHLRKDLELWYQKMGLTEFMVVKENPIVKLSVLIGERKLYNRIRQRRDSGFSEEEVGLLRQRLEQVFEEFKP